MHPGNVLRMARENPKVALSANKVAVSGDFWICLALFERGRYEIEWAPVRDPRWINLGSQRAS
jgi:hypothetical protein